MRCTIAWLFILASFAAAQDPKAFDLDKDKDLDQDEITRLILHVHNPTYVGIDGKADGTPDGEILKAEIEAYLRDTRGKNTAAIKWNEYLGLKGARDGISYAEARTLLELKKKPESINLWGFRIRKTHEDLSVADEGRSFDKAEGALFSLSRNLENGENAYQIRATVLRPFTFDVSKANRSLSTVFFVPAISLDRLPNDDPKKDVDSVVGRLYVELEFSPQPSDDPGFTHFFRLGGAYATDFSLESGTVAAEFAWLPMYDKWALAGSSQPILNGLLDFMWDLALQVHYGDTLSAGNKPNLVKDDTFLRGGPRIKLTFWPLKGGPSLQRLKFTLQWQLFQKIGGDRGSIDLLDVGLTYKIDEKGHFNVKFSFQNGQIILTEERTQTFTIALTVKF